MKKFNIEVKLTNDEVILLQELELDGNKSIIPWQKLQIVESLEMKGLLIQGSCLDESYMFMTDIGVNILKLIN
jgi:hypothetical protein